MCTFRPLYANISHIMITTLVVDGYNAINAIPHVQEELKKSLFAARKAILAICKEYARSSGYITDFKVVFDGKDQYRRLEGVVIPRKREQVFAATGEGDDKIIAIIKKCAKVGRVVVASNDNYVRNNARAYGASRISSEELVRTKKTDLRQSDTGSKSIDNRTQFDITEHYKRKLGL